MSAAVAESPNVGEGWMVHDRVVTAVTAERARAEEWAERSASRVRTFVPEPVHVPKHRAEPTAW